jgi:hypothetical protein
MRPRVLKGPSADRRWLREFNRTPTITSLALMTAFAVPLVSVISSSLVRRTSVITGSIINLSQRNVSDKRIALLISPKPLEPVRRHVEYRTVFWILRWQG